MAFTAIATKVYKDPVTTVWANSLKGNDDLLYTGIAKAWVVFDGSAAAMSAMGSFNVASIADSGAGIYRINFTTGFATTAIIPIAIGDASQTKMTIGVDVSATLQTASVRLLSTNGGGTAADSWVFAAFFGGLN